ncbi:MAG: thioredoxin domain-containing protein [Clostridia bacterium]|nr:thioredoxin domain-containing protein [Clostridia bacterium]
MSNRLIRETSPYLLAHAENPVDWYPWGEEAFFKARAEDKPIFLSIGYSTCHWCHVMARESFEDAKTAEILNRCFVPVKVDREERPDVDGVYMAACQTMTGSGGWPMSLFLTPDGKPFYAGTYFPKTAVYGLPAFSDLLKAIRDAWTNDRENLLRSADAITAALSPTDDPKAAPKEDLTKTALTELRRVFDATYGGFGPSPKFPSPHTLLFLLQQYEKTGDSQSLHMAEMTLERMYAGGLFDHIGGGFCRYSTDRRFLVPHFEKMLYDNALLILAYCKAYELTNDPFYRDTAEQTAAFLLREMRAENDGFYCAQDADSEGREGFYYLFTPTEIVAVLGMERGEAFNACFDITETGNFEGKNVPNLLKHPRTGERFEDEKKRLLAYRKRRAALKTDDKQLAFWNALTVAALCALYRVNGNPEYLRAAEQTMSFIRTCLMQGDTLFTSCRAERKGSRAFLDDHAGLALALLSLYDATLDTAYLDAAVKRTRIALEQFFDAEAGGFFFSGTENEPLLIRSKETYDGALPSGNSIMTCVLVRLSVLRPDDIPAGVRNKQLAFMKAQAASVPMGSAMFLFALSDEQDPPAKIVAVAAREERKSLPVLVPLGTNVIVSEATDEYPLVNGKSTYYVCSRHRCFPPVNDLTKEMLLR